MAIGQNTFWVIARQTDGANVFTAITPPKDTRRALMFESEKAARNYREIHSKGDDSEWIIVKVPA